MKGGGADLAYVKWYYFQFGPFVSIVHPMKKVGVAKLLPPFTVNEESLGSTRNTMH